MSGARLSSGTDADTDGAAVAGERYDAFMSYSHECDGVLAPVLQSGVERFAKPWNRIRALRVFRDQTSLSAEPKLWPSIERALSGSGWFVLLASNEAARSPWVDREVGWWLRHRSSDRLLLVATHGRLRWDDERGDFDWSYSSALPPSLRGAFSEEPRWVDVTWSHDTDHFSTVDPRFQEAIADISSRIRGVPKDELVGAAVREHRRTRRIVRGVQATLATLLLVSIVATMFALAQRSNAVRQATLATSRQVAAVAQSELPTNLGVALLLGVKAYRMNPNPVTRAALLQADLYSPRLVRFLPMGGRVSTLTASGDGGTIVSGLANGGIDRYVLGQKAAEQAGTLPAAATSVAADRSGGLIAATDGVHAVLWRAGGGAVRVGCPAGGRADNVGVSPSGHTVVLDCMTQSFGGAERVAVLDATGTVRALHEVTAAAEDGARLVPVSDDRLFIFENGGPWQWRRLSDWAVLSSSSGGFGAHQGASAYSPDAGFVTVTNGAPAIPVWPTSAPTTFDPTAAPLVANAPISAPTALALSRGGTELAAADSGTVYVAPVARSGAQAQSASALPGNGSVNTDTLRFADPSHLISASGSSVAYWSLTQLDRLARAQPSTLAPPCNGCPGALAAVSPDGTRIAAVADNGNSVVIQRLDAPAAPETISGYAAGPPVWDGSVLLLPLTSSGAGSRLPSDVRTLPPVSNTGIVGAALTNGHRVLVLVDDTGAMFVQNPLTGAVVRRYAGPRDLRANSATPLQPGMAAIDPATGLVAIVDNGVVELRRAADGSAIKRIPGHDADDVAFAGGDLIVQHGDGTLSVWDASGVALKRTLGGDQSYAAFYPVADPSGDLIARQRTDGTVTLTDLTSGATLANISTPIAPSLEPRLGLAFSPDGRHFITVAQAVGLSGSQIINRDISAGALIASACRTAGRDLTASEWRTFVASSPPGGLACR